MKYFYSLNQRDNNRQGKTPVSQGLLKLFTGVYWKSLYLAVRIGYVETSSEKFGTPSGNIRLRTYVALSKTVKIRSVPSSSKDP